MPGPDQGKISLERGFQEILFTIKNSRFTSLRDRCADSVGGVESGNVGLVQEFAIPREQEQRAIGGTPAFSNADFAERFTDEIGLALSYSRRSRCNLGRAIFLSK
jgi:hypothetical protein